MLYIASDHAGFQLKKYLLRYLKNQLKIEAEDLGPEKYDKDDDFPDYAAPLVKKVLEKPDNRGIVICGSGHGVCIMANRFENSRAILGYSIEAAEMGRREEDANILCLAGRVVSDEHAAAIVKKFLETDFDNKERRIRRIKEIEKEAA